MHRFSILAALLLAQNVSVPECGHSGAASGGNVQPIVVDSGPANNYFNGAFTSVTLCVPGQSSNCQTISGILVDTGSSGLRVLSSALTLSLPQQTIDGSPVATCGEFVDGYTWGPVQQADITMADETAPSVPIQVIGAPGFSNVPAACSSTGPAENTLDALGANGILGVGVFRQDCGIGCAVGGLSNPGIYYTCSSFGCQTAIEPVLQQLQNPVWLFASDNNGLAIELPAVPANGEVSVNGAMIFGIGTQGNNALGQAKVQTTDIVGDFTTTFAGVSYNSSYIDSGTNGYFFLDSPTTGLAGCQDAPDFYCPPASQTLSAVNRGVNGVSTPVSFSIGNADQLLNNLAFSVFGNVGGSNPGGFAWGLPFFYGRTVFTAIESQATPAGQGPYWAY